MKNAGIFVILFCFACFGCYAENYHLSFLQTDGGFEFFMMQSSETGHVHGKFPKQQKPWLDPKPEISVTLGMDLFGRTPVHHLYPAFGLVTFAIKALFFKIESDRTVSIWGGEPNDRVWIYNRDNLNLRLACECFRGSVWYRLSENEGWKQIVIKKFNK